MYYPNGYTHFITRVSPVIQFGLARSIGFATMEAASKPGAVIARYDDIISPQLALRPRVVPVASIDKQFTETVVNVRG